MLKIEKIILFLIISVCFLLCFVIVGSLIDPAVFWNYGYASEPIFRDNQKEEQIPGREKIDPPVDWQLYRNEDFGFEIFHPLEVSPKIPVNRDQINAGIGYSSDVPVWKFTLPDADFYQGTNLVEAALVINVDHKQDSVLGCLEPKEKGTTRSGAKEAEIDSTEMINGVQFHKDEVLEGGMGKFYQMVSYRAVQNDACYEITLLVHFLNIDNFASGVVAPYPKGEVENKLDQMLSTFRFLDVSPPFPEQVIPDSISELKGEEDPSASGDYVDGIDVSHWQGDINWGKVGETKYKFAFVKATEGVGFKDWKFVTNIENGTAEGVLMGPYHFARPDLNNSGAKEAEYFLSEVGDYIEAGYLRPVLDLEVNGGLGKKALSAWVVDWMETVKDATGVEPLIYLNYYYISELLNKSVKDYDLWIAYWTCDPTPTETIPPTGQFADWDFWQYQAPSYCGYFSIPGIKDSVDLNIFNGMEADLPAFESDAPLWVNLMNYSYQGPAPHYADLSIDVNGSTTGPVNFAVWWDCDELGTDILSLGSVCGVLPEPGASQCLQNEFGIWCNSINNENFLFEHTYHEIDIYHPKVVVERGNASPAEDRYSISVFNPILSITSDPIPPAVSMVDQQFSLFVEVLIDTSVNGVLQVGVIEDGTGTVEGQSCKTVGHDVRTRKAFDFSFTESELGNYTYKIWARYRPRGDCPVGDNSADDRSVPYTIDWVLPEMNITGNGKSIPDGDTTPATDDGTDFGDVVYTAGVVRQNFSIINTGGGELKLTGSPPVSISGSHADDFYVSVQPTSPIAPQGGTSSFEVVFDPTAPGLRTAVVSIPSNDADQDPYDFTIQGTGTYFSGHTIADFDGDDDTDVSVYSPTSGKWRILFQEPVSYGFPEDIPVPGDYDGDGDFDIAILRPSNGFWFIKGQQNVSWYHPDDIPVQADYNGDGITDIAVYRPSNGRWYIKGMGNFKWSKEGDIPVPCDYDGDTSDEIAFFRPSDNHWYIMGENRVLWGQTGDIPVPADYDGDGVCDIAVFRPSNGRWYIKGMGNVPWGYPGDIPVPGDYDGDGIYDIAVLRPSTHRWYIREVGNFIWYSEGDYPLPVRDTNADGDPYD